MTVDRTRPEFGVFLTATELEGCSPNADWSRWVAAGRAPDSGRDSAAVPFRRSWPEDLELVAALGADTVVITLEWADLEPRPGDHDPEAVDFRRDILQGAAEAGLTAWACLVDRTLPGWFADDEGGFGDDRARSLLWPRHIDWIGETFGDLVEGWVPQREPLLHALRRFWLATAPPGRHDPALAASAVRDAMLAEGEAWRLLRGSAPVATHQTARLVVAEKDDPRARGQAAAVERLLWQPWLRALTGGTVQAGDLPERNVEHLRDAFDQIVVQLRAPIRVDGRGRWLPHPADRRPGPSGLVAHPEAMAEALTRVTTELDGRTIVAAGDLADVAGDGADGGATDGGAAGSGRAGADHERQVLALVDEHRLAGWWQTSPIDGYHFERGFEIRPGLVTAGRVETLAARVYREAAQANRATSEEERIR